MSGQSTRGAIATRLIVVVGVAASIFLLVFAYGLRQAVSKGALRRPAGAMAGAAFDGKRAFESLKRIVAIGPRTAGSKESEATRGIIREELTEAGVEVMEMSFNADTPLGSRSMVNMVGVVKGTTDGIIALSNHYDTKYFPDFAFVGANDGGSTTAWMLEMARTLGPAREGRSVWLIWFDGEEAFKEWTDSDSLYGSRAFVKHMTETNELSQIKALINVDMIGDCKLGITRDAGAPSWLLNAIWKSAAQRGQERAFGEETNTVQDDHIPFRFAGVSCANLIDFEYGGSMADHNENWHTTRDQIGLVCPESLQAVGDVIYHALPAIDAYLDTQAK